MKTIALALVACLTVLSVPLRACPEAPSPAEPADSPAPIPGRVRIEVLSQLGKPISEARVVFYRQPGPDEEPLDPCGTWEESVAKTVSPGIFEEEVRPGTYRVEATGDEWIGAVEEKVEIKSGETREIKFQLEPGSVISGRVIDEGGNPLADVEASYLLSGFRPSALLRSRQCRTFTDASGCYAFRSLAPGVYDLKFSRPEYVAAEADDVAAGTTDLETVLNKGYTIRGRLEGATEGLESPVRLKLESVGIRSRRTFSRRVKLGPENDFEISDLERKIYSIRLQDKDYFSDWIRQVEALSPEEAVPITLIVSRGASISGRVTASAADVPLSGVNLRLIPAGSRTGDFARSDSRGEFSFRGLAGGEYTLKARLWQDQYSKSRLEKKVVIEPGRELSGFDLELEVGREVTFSGGVFDGRGDPVGEADIRISFRPAGEKSYRQNFRDRVGSESSGDFTLSAYLDSGGELLITAGKEGYAAGEMKLELSPEQSSVSGVVLVLDYGVTLEVEAGGGEEGREPAPSAIVTLGTDWSEERESPNYVTLKKLTDARGRCRFENLVPDAYRIEVSKPGYSPVKEKVRLNASEPVKTVSVILKPGRTLLVRAEDEDGKAVAGAAIGAREKTGEMKFIIGDPTGENRTDPGGVCLLRDLPAAPLILSAQADGYVSIRRRKVGAEEDEVTLIMKAAGSIRGRFLREEGRPLADLNMIARKRSAGSLDFESYFSDKKDLGDGVFQVSNLSPGVYDLTIRSEDRAGRRIEAVEVEAGRETDLGEIVLGPGSSISGRVSQEEDGSSLKGAWVRVEAPAEGMMPLFTTSDMTGPGGAFTVSGLSPGTFVLAVSARDFRSEKIAGITVGSGEEKEIPDIHLARLTEAEREELARRRNVVPSLGVRIAESGLRGEAGPPTSLVIEEVLRGTAAANSGLAAGDEIVKINGKSLSEEPMEFLQGLMAAPGTELKVTVKRAETGREEEVGLTVDQWGIEDVIRQATQAD